MLIAILIVGGPLTIILSHFTLSLAEYYGSMLNFMTKKEESFVIIYAWYMYEHVPIIQIKIDNLFLTVHFKLFKLCKSVLLYSIIAQ